MGTIDHIWGGYRNDTSPALRMATCGPRTWPRSRCGLPVHRAW